MKRNHGNLALIAVLAVVWLFTAGSARADLIMPTGVTATSWYTDAETHPNNLINGSEIKNDNDILSPDLSAESADATHESHPGGPGFSMWHAGSGTPGTGPGVVADQVLIFELGGKFDLTEAYIWQFNQSCCSPPGRGVDEFTLHVSTDGVDNFGPAIGGTLSLPPAFATEPITATSFPLVASGVTHVKIEILSAQSGNLEEYVGLSEVRFESSSPPVLIGDINLDLTVDRKDVAEFVTHYGEIGSVFTTGDFDSDSITGLSDLALMQLHFGETIEGTSPSAVPEPSTFSMLIIGCVLFGWKRRVKSR